MVTPASVLISALIPGNGRVADPGLVRVRPGSGAIMIAPVSVCHHVSTIGHRSPPMKRWYHTQASGLIGSPTEPNRRSDDMSRFAGHSVPHFMNARMAVGAVEKMVTPYGSTICQNRSFCGQSGAPSYITTVAPLLSGPYTT